MDKQPNVLTGEFLGLVWSQLEWRMGNRGEKFKVSQKIKACMKDESPP